MVNQRINIRDVALFIGNIRVGGGEEISVTIAHEVTEADEAGNYFPVEMVDGNIRITGTINRAFIDVDLLNTIAPNTTGIWPSFDITGQIVSGKTPARNITIFGAKFNSVDINSLGLDGYAKNALEFKALSWKFDT